MARRTKSQNQVSLEICEAKGGLPLIWHQPWVTTCMFLRSLPLSNKSDMERW